ncbi:hypothetical protein RHD99_15920 [Buttiauxella selenatireducens]|uniref:Uncharacterized protein n=1 Tax=Buttiauxella selenatireducens TaxID=3073902 RepID=A0ABY9S5Z4_9ENTR|nr:hypothetical protein [Buttiauxella sp. R73]WMY72948.1 hypothetical protein RHD99_15920 [Buttiauxella sp. R73]
MKSKILSVIIPGLIFGVLASGSAYAQNMPFDAGGGGKTIYGPWKKITYPFVSAECKRTVYYKNGSKKTETKHILFFAKC